MMSDICGAGHPTYKKLFCCFGLAHETPHSAPIRRGQWVTWTVAVSRPRRQTVAPDCDIPSPDAGPTPKVLYLENEHYGIVGSKSRGRCWYCGIGFSHLKRTLDHVVPRSRGGPNDPSNLVFACQPCNTAKANMSLEFYRQHLQRTQQRERVVFYGEAIE